MHWKILVLLAAHGWGVSACGDFGLPFERQGRARVAAGGDHGATLQAACRMPGMRVFGIDVSVPDMALRDLDVPAADGVIAASPIEASLTWTSATSRASLTAPVLVAAPPLRGSGTTTDAGTVLRVDDLAALAGAAEFLAGLADEPGTLTVTQADSSDPQRRLAATFAFDAAAARDLRMAAQLCMYGTARP